MSTVWKPTHVSKCVPPRLLIWGWGQKMYIWLDGRVYVLNLCCQKRLARPKRLHCTQPRWCGAKLESGQSGTVRHSANSGESGRYSLPVQKRRKKRSRTIEEAERRSREERMQREKKTRRKGLKEEQMQREWERREQGEKYEKGRCVWRHLGFLKYTVSLGHIYGLLN